MAQWETGGGGGGDPSDDEDDENDVDDADDLGTTGMGTTVSSGSTEDDEDGYDIDDADDLGTTGMGTVVDPDPTDGEGGTSLLDDNPFDDEGDLQDQDPDGGFDINPDTLNSRNDSILDRGEVVGDNSGSAGNLSVTQPYNPSEEEDQRAMARLYVGGVRIPVINEGLTLHERKDGPTDRVMLARARVPVQAFGVNWFETINPLDNQTNGWDKARIEVMDPITDTWTTWMVGFVSRVSPNGEQQNEATLEISDMGQLLSSIPVDKTFGDVTPKQTLEFIRDEFVDGQPVFNNIPIYGTFAEQGDIAEDIFDGDNLLQHALVGFVGSLVMGDSNVYLRKEFKDNRHSLMDVFQWLKKKTSSRIWVGPDGDGVAFYVMGEPCVAAHSHLDGPVPSDLLADIPPSGTQDVAIIKNNALYEIATRNAIHAKGTTDRTLAVIEGFEINAPMSNGSFGEVLVEHPGMVNVAGARLTGPVFESNGNTLEEVVNDAKSELKRVLDQASGGSMETFLAPQVHTYHAIMAPPVVNGEMQTTNPNSVIRYEVEEVEHRITATEGKQTKLHLSPLTPMSQIEVVAKGQVSNPDESISGDGPTGGTDEPQGGTSGGDWTL